MKGLELNLGTVLLLAVLVGGFLYLYSPETLQNFFSQSSVTQTSYQEPTTTTTTAGTGTQTQTTEELYPIDTVNLYVMDALNVKSGVANVEVEVLEPVAGKTDQEVASDPMRAPIDEDTSTDANGKATFSSGTILAKTPYIYSVRGNSNVYDYITRLAVPINPAGKALTYTFPEKIYVYQVGSFSDIFPSGATNSGWDSTDHSADTLTLNVTGKSGPQYAYIDLTIEEADTGKALKNPVIEMYYPSGYDMPSGAITSIYLTKRTGSSFGIPGGNLVSYVDSAPIPLTGEVTYKDGAYWMTVANSGTYRLKFSWDADTMVSGDKLEICLDDLGGSELGDGRDLTTKGKKASPKCITIQTVS